MGIEQGTLFKVMKAKNKRDVEILICLLCEYLFVCRKLEIYGE